jgi:hypothetical protein
MALAKPSKSTGCLSSVALVVVFVVASAKWNVVVGTFAAFATMLGLWGAVYLRNKQRFAALAEAYGEDNAQRIVSGSVWEGATAEMIRESLGEPASIDQKVMATRVRQVFKFGQTGKNRYAMRVTLDDGVVTGWETSGK